MSYFLNLAPTRTLPDWAISNKRLDRVDPI